SRLPSPLLDDDDRFPERDEEHAAPFGRHGVDRAGRRVEIVAGLQTVTANAEIAFEHEDFLAGGVIVCGKRGARREAHERRRFPGVLVVAKPLHRDAGDPARCPLRGSAADERLLGLWHRRPPGWPGW